MKMKQKIISLIAICFLCWAKVFSQNTVDFSKPVAISKSNQLTEKWGFLKSALKDRRIVCLGESLHGVSEYNKAKFEIIQYLHEIMGYNVVAFESDMALNYFGSKYRNEIPDSLFLEKAFTPVWHTDTYLNFVKYLKLHPDLKIIGFDFWDVDGLDSICNIFGVHIDADLTNDKKLLEQYSILKSKNHAVSSFTENPKNRDSIMAINIKWIAEELYPNEKMIISAANDHISKLKTNDYTYMGEILSQFFKENMYCIGFFHSLGNPTHIYRDYFYENDPKLLDPNSLQARLLTEKADHIFIEISKLKRSKNYQWVDTEVKHILQTKKYEYTVNLSQPYDAIIWFRQVTHPNYVIDSDVHWLMKK